ncbi:MAG TPA: hypothetical protein VFA34_14895 [Actinomycetota bacterium]|jgi:hypothetical protein|nr:hypothetical protein [Actinomycetota bacterium]
MRLLVFAIAAVALVVPSSHHAVAIAGPAYEPPDPPDPPEPQEPEPPPDAQGAPGGDASGEEGADGPDGAPGISSGGGFRGGVDAQPSPTPTMTPSPSPEPTPAQAPPTRPERGPVVALVVSIGAFLLAIGVLWLRSRMRRR